MGRVIERLTRFRWERLVVSERGPVSPTTRLVLLALATHLNREGQAWPSEKTLALETGLSERAVLSHLEIAVTDSWIERAASRDQGKAWRRYTYTIRTPSNSALRTAPRSAPPQPQGDAPRSGANRNGPESDAEGAERHAQGAAPDDSLVLKDVQINNEVITSLNTSKNTAAKPALLKEGDGEHSNPKVKIKDNGGLQEWALAHGYERLTGESEPEFTRRLTERWLQAGNA